MPDLVPFDDSTSAGRFLARAQAVADGQSEDLIFDPQQLIRIASDSNERNNFVTIFRTEIASPVIRSAIIEFIEETAEALEGNIDTLDTVIELIDRASLPIATAAVLSGIGLFVSLGVSLGPIAIFTGGLFSLAASGTGRTVLRLRGNRNKGAVKKLRRFAARLRSL